MSGEKRTDMPGTCLPGFMQAFMGSMDSAAMSSNPWIKAVARSNIEMLALSSRRAQAIFEIPTRASTCRTPQDVVSEGMRFWQTCFQQYADSGRRIAAAWAEAAPAFGTGMQSMWQAGAESAAKSRDYITFPEPRESAASQPQSAPAASPAGVSQARGGGRRVA
jgi:hypothetical protein